MFENKARIAGRAAGTVVELGMFGAAAVALCWGAVGFSKRLGPNLDTSPVAEQRTSADDLSQQTLPPLPREYAKNND